MKRILLATTLVLSVTGGAFAQNNGRHNGHVALCDGCGVVQHVVQEKRKGSGGAVGVIGGAVVGGLLGNQIGGGTGKTLATVGGAAAGGYAGNEVQKHVNSKVVWVTRVKMKDGSIRTFEQQAQPNWAAGNVVRTDGKNLHRV